LKKKFIVFAAKFLLLFALFYFGTLGVIGLASPGRLYSPFVDHYFDYVSWIKWSLLAGTKLFLSIFGIPSYIEPAFIMQGENGYRVELAMDCVGYGVYSFWAAYVIAGDDSIGRKIKWVTGGLLLLWAINVIRISGVLVAINRQWAMPLGIDHHTWFNIFAYAAIFGMMYFFERREKVKGGGLTVEGGR
jgi:exosortase/archaeosortase family protein